jgi:hypothetical protein
VSRTRLEALVTGALTIACFLGLRHHLFPETARWLGAVAAHTLPAPGGATQLVFPWLAWAVHRALLLAHAPSTSLSSDFFPLFDALAAGVTIAIGFSVARRIRLGRANAIVAATVLSCALGVIGRTRPEALAATPFVALAALFASGRRPVLAGLAIGIGALFHQAAFFALPLLWPTLARDRLGSAFERGALRTLSAIGTFVALGSLASIAARYPDPTSLPFGWLAQTDLFAVPRTILAVTGAGHAALVSRSALLALTWAERVRCALVALSAFAVVLTGARARSKAAIATAWFWLTGVYLLACYWSDPSEKLCLGLVLVVSLVIAHAWNTPLWRERAHLIAGALLALALGAVVAHRFGPDAEGNSAQELARRIAPTDLLVCAGWQPLCAEYAQLGRPQFSLAESDPQWVLASLDGVVTRAHTAGHHVYFLELLDLDEHQWGSFVGHHLRLSYDALDDYRRRSVAEPGPATRGLRLRQLLDDITPDQAPMVTYVGGDRALGYLPRPHRAGTPE